MSLNIACLPGLGRGSGASAHAAVGDALQRGPHRRFEQHDLALGARAPDAHLVAAAAHLRTVVGEVQAAGAAGRGHALRGVGQELALRAGAARPGPVAHGLDRLGRLGVDAEVPGGDGGDGGVQGLGPRPRHVPALAAALRAPGPLARRRRRGRREAVAGRARPDRVCNGVRVSAPGGLHLTPRPPPATWHLPIWKHWPLAGW